MVQLMTNYFEFGQFLHCEAYTYEHCCKRVPCNVVERRAQEAYGKADELRLFVQKSHDLEYEVPVDCEQSYLVQTRDPAQAAIGWLRWEMAYGYRGNFSMGDIPGEIFKFLCYYIRFYHKWYSQNPHRIRPPKSYVLHYEDLVARAGTAVEAVSRFLQWAELPLDKARLELAFEKSLRVDAHSGEGRAGNASQYSVGYYDDICGGAFRFLLNKVAAYCPGIRFNSVDGQEDAKQRNLFEQLFAIVDLSSASVAALDFTVEARKLRSDTVAVASGCPVVSQAFGLSFGNVGDGVWTQGDVVMLPFRASALPQAITGSITFAALADPRILSGLSLDVVINGSFSPCEVVVTTGAAEARLDFRFAATAGNDAMSRDGLLVLKLTRSAEFGSGGLHMPNLLIKHLLFSTSMTSLV